MLKIPTITTLINHGLRIPATGNVEFPLIVEDLDEFNCAYFEFTGYSGTQSKYINIPYTLYRENGDMIRYPLPITAMEIDDIFTLRFDRATIDDLTTDASGNEQIVVSAVVVKTVSENAGRRIIEDDLVIGNIPMLKETTLNFTTNPIESASNIGFAMMDANIIIDKPLDDTFEPINIFDLINDNMDLVDIKAKIDPYITLAVSCRNSIIEEYEDCTDEFLQNITHKFNNMADNYSLTFKIQITKKISDIMVSILGDINIRIPDSI